MLIIGKISGESLISLLMIAIIFVRIGNQVLLLQSIMKVAQIKQAVLIAMDGRNKNIILCSIKPRNVQI
jgi:hypothetical protein